MIWKITNSMLIALFLFSFGVSAQNTPDLRHCKDWNCPSNNFTLDDVYLSLVDEFGNTINPKLCTSGEVIKAKVMLNYTSNASNTINSTRVFADLVIASDTTYINKYLGNVPGKGEPQSQQIYPDINSTEDTFNWICGTELRLEDILVVWRTGGTGDIENNYNCSSYNKSQCEFPASTIVAAPLAVQFDFTVCREGGTTTVEYTSTTNGGIKPYTVQWDFTNDGTIDFTSVIQEGSDGGSFATYTTTSPSNFTTKLKVTDSDTPNVVSSITQLIENPSELSISEEITDIGCDESGTGAIDITVTGGTGDYTYEWTGPNFSSGDEDISGLNEGSYSITVTDEYGCTLSATFNVDKVLPPSAASAGPDQSQCNTSSFTLAGNTPSAGSGEWTVVSGSASIADPGSPTSGVTVAAGVSATLRWTITNGDCSNFDEVSLTNYEDVTADAGEDQSQCNNSSFTLDGNTPSSGSGEWTVVSGSASIANSSSPTSGLTVAAGVSATLRWTITNGDCSDFDEVSLTNYEDVTADAG
ncbi:MAG: hypothetical protein R3214_07020, partial [Christiangramia sp.]|nr:hypothetical protein [Christiangramia sp.]